MIEYVSTFFCVHLPSLEFIFLFPQKEDIFSIEGSLFPSTIVVTLPLLERIRSFLRPREQKRVIEELGYFRPSKSI